MLFLFLAQQELYYSYSQQGFLIIPIPIHSTDFLQTYDVYIPSSIGYTAFKFLQSTIMNDITHYGVFIRAYIQFWPTLGSWLCTSFEVPLKVSKYVCSGRQCECGDTRAGRVNHAAVAHTHQSTQKHTHTLINAKAHTHTHIDQRKSIHTHQSTQKHAHIDQRKSTHTHTHIDQRKSTHTHTHIHTSIDAKAHTHTSINAKAPPSCWVHSQPLAKAPHPKITVGKIKGMSCLQGGIYKSEWVVGRVGQNHIFTLCMTVYLVISLPIITYLHPGGWKKKSIVRHVYFLDWTPFCPPPPPYPSPPVPPPKQKGYQSAPL